MFDSVQVKKELPLSEELKTLQINWKEISFQTKDLENCLLDYHITEDGDLMLENVEYEYVYYTEEEKKHKDFKPWNLVKETIEKSRSTEKVDYHGKISFYTHEEFSDTEDVWIDFEAYFIYGKLDKIELVKVEKFKSHKIKNEEWFKQMAEEKNKLSYKLKKRFGWFCFWNNVSKICLSTSHAFQQLNVLIVRHML